MLIVWAALRISRDWSERESVLAFTDRICRPPEIGECQAENNVALRILWCRLQLLLQRNARRIRVHACMDLVAAQPVGLGKNDPPCTTIVVEGGRRQLEQARLLRVGQCPVEIPILGEVCDQYILIDT